MSYAPGINNPAPTRNAKKERKVSIVFRRSDEQLHCAGIESLQLLQDGALLTASRDSTVKRWDVQGLQPVCQTTFEGHTDWVNDLAVYKGEILFSCSNDRTVRAWQANQNGKLITSLCHHSDYVTCLAAAQHRPLVASGGLRGEVFLIDVQTGMPMRLRPKMKPGQSPGNGPSSQTNLRQQYSPAQGGQFAADAPEAAAEPRAGVYSLACNSSGVLVAAGSSDHVIRIWDARSGEKVCKLRGHTDNVRCMILRDDPHMLLSGGSDGTLRLWDLGMQRCIQTYAVHSDSVWCMSVSSDWANVISGGRDKCVYRTRLNSRSTELLLQEHAPVTSMAVDHSSSSLWVGTTQSSVNKWAIPRDSSTGSHAGVRLRTSIATARRSVEALQHCTPAVTKPCAVIPGLPPLVAHKVLSDRRHILVKDDQGEVGLWDVLAGAEVKAFGKVELDAQEAALFDAKHTPSWFMADNRLGTLSITLEPQHCFNAEEYAQAMGYNNAPDDQKVNYGQLVLEGIFAKWKQRVLQQHQQQSQTRSTPLRTSSGATVPADLGSQTAAAVYQQSQQQQQPQQQGYPQRPQQQYQQQQLSSGGGSTTYHHTHPDPASHVSQGAVTYPPGHPQHSSGPTSDSSHSHHQHSASQQQQQGSSNSSPRNGQVLQPGLLQQVQQRQQEQAPYVGLWPAYWRSGLPPWVCCATAGGLPWKKCITAFTGAETEPEDVPAWVGDVLLHNAAVAPREPKCSFVLYPEEGSGLPSLLNSKLSAPRILQVHKVAAYCLDKLTEQNIPLTLTPVYLRPPATTPAALAHIQQRPGSKELEITCNGYAVPFELSLSSVKKFIWCKSDDIQFIYRIKNPNSPAPLPRIGPPKQ